MTCGTIIQRARDLTDIGSSGVLSSAEAFASLNESYRDIYERILDANDDYFAKEFTVAFSSLVPIPDQPTGFMFDLPADFYRLRLLQYQAGNNWYTVQKFSPLDEVRQGRVPSYRIIGVQIKLLLPASGNITNLRGLYYPVPSTYTLDAEDINFPPQLEPAIMSYQIACDIKRKQIADFAPFERRRDELFARFLSATARRDDAQYEPINNVYQANDGWWR